MGILSLSPVGNFKSLVLLCIEFLCFKFVQHTFVADIVCVCVMYYCVKLIVVSCLGF